MKLNADLSQRAIVQSHDVPWIASPSVGVQRRMLERDGEEVARATSIVRYAAGASFERHTHALGEEFIVLEGTFEDEFGSYGPGTYVKNPSGSSHAPFTTAGCVLFVKLRHLEPDDSLRVVVETEKAPWFAGRVNGLTVQPLSEYGTEHAALVRWAPGTQFTAHRHHGGEEIFVLEGTFEDEFGQYPAGTWLRSPHLSGHRPFSTAGCTIWVKTGHLHRAL